MLRSGLLTIVLLASGLLVSAVDAGAQTFDTFVTPTERPTVKAGGSRIVGGVQARPGAWPFQVYVFAAGTACGGTLIDRSWILTAAHCVVDDNGRVTDPNDGNTVVVVQAGHTRMPALLGPGEPQIYGKLGFAKRIIAHSGYIRATTTKPKPKILDDIALIELKRPIDLPVVKLAAGGIVEAVERPGLSATAIGWGKTSGRENVVSEYLLQADLPIVSRRECTRRFSDFLSSLVTENQICAGDWGGQRTTCQGDSGGPLFAPGPDGAPYQIGVVSWGAGTEEVSCGLSPAIFTRVSRYVDWIEQYVKLPRYAAAPPPPPPAPVDTDRALVIGIDDYRDEANDLVGSGADADAMVGLLTGSFGFRPEQIKVLKDADATRDRILDAMQSWLVQGSKPGGRVFFSYSGHGFYVPDQNGDEEDGLDEVLIPHDAVPKADGTVDNIIRDDEIRDILKRMPDRKITIVVDSCHSGTMTRSLSFGPSTRFKRQPSGGFSKAKLPLPRGSVRQAQLSRAFEALDGNVSTWTAVSPSQVALVDLESPEPRGVFTSRFIAGIADLKADGNQDGKVTHAELLDHVTAESEAYCKRNPDYCVLGLTPSLEGPASIMTAEVLTGAPVGDAGSGVGGALNPVNGARLDITVEPGTERRVGSRIRIRVDSEIGGHFTLFEVAPSGSVSRILPNPDAYLEEYEIRGGRPVVVPDVVETGYEWFQVQPPAGEYLLVAVASEAPLDQQLLDNVLQIAGPKAFVDKLASELRKPTVGAGATVRRGRWSMGQTNYRIVE